MEQVNLRAVSRNAIAPVALLIPLCEVADWHGKWVASICLSYVSHKPGRKVREKAEKGCAALYRMQLCRQSQKGETQKPTERNAMKKRLIPNQEVIETLKKAKRAEDRANALREAAIDALREQAREKGLRGFAGRDINLLLGEEEGTGIGNALVNERNARFALFYIEQRIDSEREIACKRIQAA